MKVRILCFTSKPLYLTAQALKAVLTHLSGTDQWMPPGVPLARIWGGQGQPSAGGGSSHLGGLGHPGESLAPPHPCPPLPLHPALLHPHPVYKDERGAYQHNLEVIRDTLTT